MSGTHLRPAQRAATWSVALVLGSSLMVACSEQDPPAPPFAELISRGLTRYLGAAEPAETVEGGGYVTWHFDPSRGAHRGRTNGLPHRASGATEYNR